MRSPLSRGASASSLGSDSISDVWLEHPQAGEHSGSEGSAVLKTPLLEQGPASEHSGSEGSNLLGEQSVFVCSISEEEEGVMQQKQSERREACQQCGNILLADSKFCRKCGSPRREQRAAAVADADSRLELLRKQVAAVSRLKTPTASHLQKQRA